MLVWDTKAATPLSTVHWCVTQSTTIEMAHKGNKNKCLSHLLTREMNALLARILTAEKFDMRERN